MVKGKFADLTGQTFGKLTVLERTDNKGMAMWKCQCECGNTTVVYGTNLKQGMTKSCGCAHYTIDPLKHEKLYKTFKTYRNASRLCEEWQDYKVFRQFMMDNGYVEGKSKLRRPKWNAPCSPQNYRIYTDNNVDATVESACEE